MSVRTTRFACAALLAAIAVTAGCASLRGGDSARAPRRDAAMTFVLVRHAEKATDDPKDPSLSDAGRARAQRLAASFDGMPVVAVYATGYRRTQATAQPTAEAHGLPVRTYEAGVPADAFASGLRAAHVSGTVLVVGHSNTVPAIASALCRCAVAPMREDEFDRRIEIRIAADGAATLAETRY
jgi:broad specificity phosphatase PhoE